jgi:hypothetical protein
MTHLLQNGSGLPNICHVREVEKMGRVTGICTDKAASRTNHGRHLEARQSTWYLVPRPPALLIVVSTTFLSASLRTMGST